MCRHSEGNLIGSGSLLLIPNRISSLLVSANINWIICRLSLPMTDWVPYWLTDFFLAECLTRSLVDLLCVHIFSLKATIRAWLCLNWKEKDPLSTPKPRSASMSKIDTWGSMRWTRGICLFHPNSTQPSLPSLFITTLHYSSLRHFLPMSCLMTSLLYQPAFFFLFFCPTALVLPYSLTLLLPVSLSLCLTLCLPLSLSLSLSLSFSLSPSLSLSL